MTESEAKQKWCPMFANGAAIVSTEKKLDEQLSSKDRHDHLVTLTFCKGSDCMMWRQKSITEIDAKKQGYCGLAGKP